MQIPKDPRKLQNPKSSAIPDTNIAKPKSSSVGPASYIHSPKITEIPHRFRRLEPVNPEEIIIDDPVFNTPDAARILGVTFSRMEKWRARGQGPEYLRYEGGDIRYEMSALIQYKAAHRIRPSRQPKVRRRASR